MILEEQPGKVRSKLLQSKLNQFFFSSQKNDFYLLRHHELLLNFRRSHPGSIDNQGCGSGSALFLKAGSWSVLKSKLGSFNGSKWSRGGSWMLALEAYGALEVCITLMSRIRIRMEVKSCIRIWTALKWCGSATLEISSSFFKLFFL